MKFFPLATIAILALSLSSCLNKVPYPDELRPDSPLDPPGTAAARAAARAKLPKGTFENGSLVDVNQGKAFFFNSNPETSEKAGGKIVKTEKLKVVACYGSYYFAETPDGKTRGFVRETDLINHVSLLPDSAWEMNGGALPMEAGVMTAGHDLDFGDEPAGTGSPDLLPVIPEAGSEAADEALPEPAGAGGL